MKIFLLGLPGSGKTTIGKALAEALAIPFVDLDVEIEREEGMTIREIFEKKSEHYFRQAESRNLARFCELNGDCVVATGGGAPCFFNNLECINRSGKSIFLDVPPGVIAERMKDTLISKRPLFAQTQENDLKEKISSMRSQRIAFYRQAHMTFSGDAISVTEILEKIKKESQP
jgi:shikimate kinase